METSRFRKILMGIKILEIRLRFIAVIVVSGLIIGYWDTIMNYYDKWTRPPESPHVEGTNAEEVEYYCPMHPFIVRSEPGKCPICGMPLAKRAKGKEAALPEEVIARVQLTPERVEMAGIKTHTVGYELLFKEISTVGILESDERREVHIASRIAGRLDKLSVNYTGQQVRKGDPLVWIYSPSLVATQEEYLSALDGYLTAQKSGRADAVQSSKALLDSAKKRLLLWGITEEQVDRLERERKSETHLTIYSPVSGIVTEKKVLEGHYVEEGTELYTITDLSTVWLQAAVYESDIAWLKVGQPVEIKTVSFPDEVFVGTITFIMPVIESKTRTVNARVEIENPDLKLKPGMYSTATIKVPYEGMEEAKPSDVSAGTGAEGKTVYTCPMHPEVISDKPGECPKCGMTLVPKSVSETETTIIGYICPVHPEHSSNSPGPCEICKRPKKLMKLKKSLAVPESAVIDTGTRKIVYLERQPGLYDAVQVTVGPRAGDFYPVEKGLSAGDKVVLQGAFLVDAEARLSPGAGAAFFGASGAPSSKAQSGGGMAGMPGM